MRVCYTKCFELKSFIICSYVVYANKNERNTNTSNKKLKQSLYRFRHALMVPEG